MAKSNHVIKYGTLNANKLKQQAAALQQELEDIRRMTDAFETKIKAELSNELIEEQELAILYKQQKKAKKDQRRLQKQRGKNYKEPTGVIAVVRKTYKPPTSVEAKKLKRLYREAMLHVHPDRFSMEDEKLDLANETTAQLIDVYKNGDLQALTAFHAHILSGRAIEGTQAVDANKLSVDPDQYLRDQLESLQQELDLAKGKYTYIVLTTYRDPYSFIGELRAYYQDRIGKLRKRTRS